MSAITCLTVFVSAISQGIDRLKQVNPFSQPDAHAAPVNARNGHPAEDGNVHRNSQHQWQWFMHFFRANQAITSTLHVSDHLDSLNSRSSTDSTTPLLLATQEDTNHHQIDESLSRSDRRESSEVGDIARKAEEIASRLTHAPDAGIAHALWEEMQSMCDVHGAEKTASALVNTANTVITITGRTEAMLVKQTLGKWLDCYLSLARKHGAQNISTREAILSAQRPVWSRVVESINCASESDQWRLLLRLFKETDTADLPESDWARLSVLLSGAASSLAQAFADGHIHPGNRALAQAVLARFSPSQSALAPATSKTDALNASQPSCLTPDQATAYRQHLAEEIDKLERFENDPEFEPSEIMLAVMISQNKRMPGLNLKYFNYFWDVANYMRDVPEHAGYLNAVVGTTGHFTAAFFLTSENKASAWVIDSINGMYEDDIAYQLKQWETRLRLDTAYAPTGTLVSSIAIQKDGKVCGYIALSMIKKGMANPENTKKVLKDLLAGRTPHDSHEHPFSAYPDMRVHQLRVVGATHTLEPTYYKDIQDASRLEMFTQANAGWADVIVNKKGQSLNERFVNENNKKSVTVIKDGIKKETTHYMSAMNTLRRWAALAKVDLCEMQKAKDGGAQAYMQALRELAPLRLKDGSMTDRIVGLQFQTEEHVAYEVATMKAHAKRFDLLSQKTRMLARHENDNSPQSLASLAKEFDNLPGIDDMEGLMETQKMLDELGLGYIDYVYSEENFLPPDISDPDFLPLSVTRPIRRDKDAKLNASLISKLDQLGKINDDPSGVAKTLVDIEDVLKNTSDQKRVLSFLQVIYTWWEKAALVPSIDAQVYTLLRRVCREAGNDRTFLANVAVTSLARLPHIVQGLASEPTEAGAAVRFIEGYLKKIPADAHATATQTLLQQPLADTFTILDSRHRDKVVDIIHRRFKDCTDNSLKLELLRPLWMQTGILLRILPEVGKELLWMQRDCIEELMQSPETIASATMKAVLAEYPNIIGAAEEATADGKAEIDICVQLKQTIDAVNDAIRNNTSMMSS